ncbi:MAG: hypothetical protein OEZ58_14085 [Gammaproteobacteria bacterium]|nr:hypothetical protein [Gammaproteobacteria bacterium]MDH5730120.1 hypothetical protein [Gammaproteobacteria bacterium]
MGFTIDLVNGDIVEENIRYDKPKERTGNNCALPEYAELHLNVQIVEPHPKERKPLLPESVIDCSVDEFLERMDDC